MYAQEQAQSASAEPAAEGGADEKVVEAEYEEVDKDKK
jgi:hypothetical protein